MAEANVVPIGESREDKFKRIAKQRMNVALKRLKMMETLSNKASYAWTDEQVDAMEEALNNAVDAIITPLRASSADKAQPAFDF
jgi:hypothetical protein